MADFFEKYKSMRDQGALLHYSVGRRRFMIYFVLGWGGLMFLLMLVRYWHRLYVHGGWLLALWLAFSLGICCAGGYLVGWVGWREIERRVSRMHNR